MENKIKRLKPKELPLIGSGHRFGSDPLKFLNELHQEFGDIAEYSLLGSPFVAVFSPELVEQVLTKNSSNYVKSVFVRERWAPFFGHGVVSGEGEDWRLSRKALQPFMNRDKISKYFDIILKHAEEYTDSLKNNANSNINRDMMELMLVSLVKILFHSDLDDKKIERFGELFDQCVQYFHHSMTPMGIILKDFPTPPKKRFLKAIAELETLVSEVLAKTAPDDVNMLSGLKLARDENGNPFSDKLIRDNILSFFMAGHETSSLAITYTLFLLATHPEEMRKVQNEIDSVTQGRAISFQDLDQLKLTKNAINESMRIYPPVSLTGREAIGDDQLGEVKIQKGVNIIVPIFTIHHNPLYYQDPESFRPDRWEGVDFNHKRYEFLPFSAGPRFCMGANFAMMEIMTVVAVILQRFDLELISDPKLKLISSISMRPSKDIILKFKERKS